MPSFPRPKAERPRSDVDANLIHFGGSWSEAERIPVRAAVKAFEERRAAQHLRMEDESPWIAVCEPVCDGDQAYFATRQDEAGVLRAGSPEALAEKIREAGSGSIASGLS